MSTIHWISPDEYGEWDAFVTRHPLGLVYHLSSWQKVLESAFGHIRGRFLVCGTRAERSRQVYLYIYVHSWLLKNRTVSVPFATLCDPLVSTKEEFNLLWPAIEEASREHRSQRIEIRTRRIGADCMPRSVNGQRPLQASLPAAGREYRCAVPQFPPVLRAPTRGQGQARGRDG